MASQSKSKPIDPKDISVLETLGRFELINCWIRMHGRMPPKHLSAIFLRRALAYELQCKQLGGHPAAVRRALKAALKQDKEEAAAPSMAPILSPGTQLVREWNGRSYRVEVAEDGFLIDGKSYRSLSAIAKLIKEIRLEPGSASITLDAQKTDKALNVDPLHICPTFLQFSCPFQTRKRGVETRLILGQTPKTFDPILIRNVARAHHWYEAIKSGLSYDEIAKRDRVSKHRIMQTIHLAFLPPQIVKTILQGKQPTDLTTKKLVCDPLPSCWKAQDQMLKSL